jgi:hypothetical protein
VFSCFADGRVGSGAGVVLAGVVMVAVAVCPAWGLIIQPDETASKDVFVYEGLPTFNMNGGGFEVALGSSETNDVPGHDVHTLIAFDVNSVPFAPNDVTSATLNLYVIDSTQVFGPSFANPSPNAPVGAEVLAISGAWDESTVNWNTQPGTTGGVLDAVTITGVNQWATLDVTQLVRDWLSGAATNDGLMVRQPAEVFNAEVGKLAAAVYNAASASSNRPYLEVLPEPGTLGLLLIGGVLGLRRRRG